MADLTLVTAAADSGSGHLGWVEAAVIGLLQGVTELFPVSSLGHSVLIPALVGGQWARDLDVHSPESPYLAFIVGLHVATALALLVFYRRDWVRIVGGLLTSIRYRRVSTADERLAWLLILATIPVGLAGLILEHAVRTLLARPIPTAVFLALNGIVLLVAEQRRRRSAAQAEPVGSATDDGDLAIDTDQRVSTLPVRTAVLIGAAQIAALAPGISRSGITMVAGMRAGLSHQDAARFSFLLATPVILAAGVLKLPDLFGPLGDGIRGQMLLGSVLSGVGAYLAVRFLDRWFADRSLRPFAWYCMAAGIGSLLVFAVR